MHTQFRYVAIFMAWEGKLGLTFKTMLFPIWRASEKIHFSFYDNSYINQDFSLQVGAYTIMLRVILIPFWRASVASEQKIYLNNVWYILELVLLLQVVAGTLILLAMLIPFWQASVASEQKQITFLLILIST